MRFYLFVLIYLLTTNYSKIFCDEPLQEFQIKRKEIFEFSKEPTLIKKGDKIIIEFEVKDFCDVTIAIQNQDGDILRHLVSGVLGNNAPEPFQSNSLSQSIVWDSKDDRGKYIDDLKNISVRVSLGLKPMYEKDLYTSPYKRISPQPSIAVAKEGVYVYEGLGRDQLRLFGHNGEYIKTIYPFPASKIDSVKGIDWTSIANRTKVPFKFSVYHQTLLTSGHNFNERGGPKSGMEGKGASAIGICNNRIAVVMNYLNRISSDGSTGGFNLTGPKVGFDLIGSKYTGGAELIKSDIGPASVAFSPDGKLVYLTGYLWKFFDSGNSGNLPVVMKLNYETDDTATVFAGRNKIDEYGSDDDKLNTPTSVDTDSKGNVYVSDFWNDRIQIFNPEGKVLSTIKTNKPAKVLVHKLTDEIFVFSYGAIGVPPAIEKSAKYNPLSVPQKISSFSAYPNIKELNTEDFPYGPYASGIYNMFYQGSAFQIGLDSWSKQPAFWIVARKDSFTAADDGHMGRHKSDPMDWKIALRRIEKVDSKWTEVDNFGSRASKQIVRPKPPSNNVQHLSFNPKSKKLYIGEGDSAPESQAYNQLIEVDVETGKSKIIELPLNPMEVAFDLDGLIYLRTMNVVSRFTMDTWKEVPFDYGAESDSVGNDGGLEGRASPVIAALMIPATNAVCYHQGGLDVNVNGDILVACHNRVDMGKSSGYGGDAMKKSKVYKKYAPPMFPGRIENSTSVSLHIWDKYGKVKFTDVIPGCPKTDGAFMDAQNNVYILATPPRKINNKEIDDGMSSTLFKFKPNNGRFLAVADTPVALPPTEYPKRPQEIRSMWAENYEWIYGGVGFAGFNASKIGGGCACWFVRFKLDYFSRSFAPEPMQYSVSVLDSKGNLIVRIGKYGNADSCGPKSLEPLGGDEVGLFHPCFVGTHTDHRLFISDIGNDRILSVKLGYHTEKILMIQK